MSFDDCSHIPVRNLENVYPNPSLWKKVSCGNYGAMALWGTLWTPLTTFGMVWLLRGTSCPRKIQPTASHIFPFFLNFRALISHGIIWEFSFGSRLRCPWGHCFLRGPRQQGWPSHYWNLQLILVSVVAQKRCSIESPRWINYFAKSEPREGIEVRAHGRKKLWGYILLMIVQ